VVSALNRRCLRRTGAARSSSSSRPTRDQPWQFLATLLDSSGRLIGINTAIFSPSGAYAGVGFAVPVDTVNRVVPQLVAKGKYTRPVLGISTDEQVNQFLKR
jgi:S1-C subfamily serine protease